MGLLKILFRGYRILGCVLAGVGVLVAFGNGMAWLEAHHHLYTMYGIVGTVASVFVALFLGAMGGPRGLGDCS